MSRCFKQFCILMALGLLAVPVKAQQQTLKVETSEKSHRAVDPRDPVQPANNENPRLVGQLMQDNGGSLLKATLQAPVDPNQAPLGSVSFFAVPLPEPRVIQKHDLVTIIVRQESEFESDGKTETSKEATIDAALEQFLRFHINDGNLRVDGNAIAAGSEPAVRANAQREFTGEGTVERTDSFITRIQARVVDVKPNDTIVIEARSALRHDDEFQSLILSGTCRAEDITADNSLLSTQLYDLKVDRQSKGNVRNATKKGWIPKLLDVLNPF